MQRKTMMIAVFISFFLASPCMAWIAEGHARATKYAIELIKEKVPGFFVAGTPAVAHCSGDPDIFKVSVGSKQLNKTESPEHYIDLELLNGKKLPESRREFARLFTNTDRTPEKVGTLPYAVVEWAQRLTLAFAEYRKWPDNEIIRAKCLIYAGNLAHYAEDMCMPLHTTVHHDGMVRDKNAPSPKTGIHLKVDALISKVPECDGIFAEKQEQVVPFDDLWVGIINQLEYSHSLIPKVYALEASLPKLDEPIQCGTPVAEFSEQSLKQTARFMAQLFLTAWNDSKDVELPSWDHREQTASMYEISDTRKSQDK